MNAGTGENVSSSTHTVEQEKEILMNEEEKGSKFHGHHTESTGENHRKDMNLVLLGEYHNKIKILVAVQTSLCTALDGFILIFISYNSAILNKEWKRPGESNIALDMIYHLISALGGIVSIMTCHRGNKIGLNYALMLSLLAVVTAIPLITTKIYSVYLITFFILCLSNGHLYNIGTNLIIKNFSKDIRASVYVFVYFFTQFGKFMFACLIYKYSEILLIGNICITVVPVIVLLLSAVLCSYFLLYYLHLKSLAKKNQSGQHAQTMTHAHESTKNNIKGFFSKHLPHLRLIDESSYEEVNRFDIFIWLFDPIKDIFHHSPRNHSLILLLLNFSLGIQFFSMINVFPRLHLKSIFTVLADEIFYSKLFHTVFLLFLPLLFLFKCITTKFLLLITFTLNLVLNALIMLNVFNSYWFLHMFRFVWNVCFITSNLYCAEAISKKLRGVNTSVMYFTFKVSCVMEILAIDKVLSISLFLPIMFNILILFFDIVIVTKLQIETHMKHVDEIELDIIRLNNR